MPAGRPGGAGGEDGPPGFDVRAWIRGPRHRDAPGVYAYGRDARALKLRELDERARTRPEAAVLRRAILWLVIALFTMRWSIPLYVWLVTRSAPDFLWPLLLGNLFWVLFAVLFGWLGRWHDLLLPYLRPLLKRLDRRAERNGRPRPEAVRRAVLFLALGFIAWASLMRPFVDLLLLFLPRGALHDAQWLVRILYNGAFIAAAAWLGRWHGVLGPYLRTPEPVATAQEGADEGAADIDPWPELRDAGCDRAADVLEEEADEGRLSDVDYLRLRHVIDAGEQDPGYLAEVAAEIETFGAGACVHDSGLRDIAPRGREHDLMTGQVRVGTADAHPRNPKVYRGVGFALEPDVLATSMLVVGPDRAGESAALLTSVVEAMSLRALTGSASLLVLDGKGDGFARPGGYDREVIVGDPASPWGLDLFGGAATPEDAADRLAAAAVPAGPADPADGARTALQQVLGPYVAAYGGYPTLGVLLDLLDGSSDALGALHRALRARGRAAQHERALRARARGDEAARTLVQRLGVLERPGIATLFDPDRPRVGIRDIDRPLRVRVALNEAAHPDAARIIGRLVLSRFVQTIATPAPDGERRRHFACLVADDAGRLIDGYTAQGLHWARTRRAGMVLSVRSLDDLAPSVRGTVFGAAGCKAVVPGAAPSDAEAFAEHWGKVKEEERSITHGTPEGGLLRRARYSLMGTLFGEKASGRSERVTVRTVERYRWSPSEITGDLAARHALVSLTTRKGERTPPVLVDLGD